MNFILHIKYALKNIKAEIKTSTIIIFGFLVSILSTFIIYNFVQKEQNYDTHYSNGDCIYRIEQKNNVMFPGAIGDCLKQKIPQIKTVVRLNPWNNPSVSNVKDQQKITVSGDIFQTEITWNELFGLHIIEGDITKVFVEKNTIALNETTAKKIFGKTEVIGKEINLNHKFSKSEAQVIAAVYKDIPENFSMRPIGIYSLKNDKDLHSRNFKSYSIYIKLSQNSSLDHIVNEINKLLISEGLIQNSELISLCKIEDVHFSGKIDNDYIAKGDKTKLYYFILIAIVIYFISLVNYFNFRIVLRQKKKLNVLINKVVGASDIDIIITYYFENLILLFIATIVSFVVIIFLRFILPSYNIFGGCINILVYSLLFIVFTSTLITLIPYSFSFLRSSKQNYNKYVNPVISTIQFAIIFILLVCTVFIYKHKEYLLSYSLGISKNNVISVQLNTNTLKYYNELTSEFKSHSQVLDVTYASNGPNEVEFKISTEKGKEAKLGVWIVDNNFMSFFDIKAIEGEGFNGKTPISDYNTVVNKKAFEKYNLEINESIPTLWSKCKLSGVCEDFNYQSLHSNIEPLCLIYQRNYCNVAFVKYMGNSGPVLEHLRKTVDKFNPELPFQYTFLKDTFYNYYKSEIYLLNLLTLFCIVAVFITIIGLLGLTNVIIQKRIREIGIRKTNGANTIDILLLINKNLFFRLILAFIFGAPAAYMVINIWLENFAYKTPLTCWYFLFAAFVIITLTFLTISPVCIRASKTNPSEILKLKQL